jgi:DNA polymerase I
MNIQILDIDYVNKKNGPMIRIFGKDDLNKSVCCFIPNFKPYFYASVSENIGLVKQQILDNFDVVESIEFVDKYYPIGYQKSKQTVLKIYTKTPKDIIEIRSSITNMKGVEAVYETDICLKNRFLIDKKIHGMRWASIKCMPLTKSMDNEILCDNVVMASDIKEIDKISNSQLKYVSFDIECLPLDGAMPTPETSPIIMISFAFSSKYKGHDSLILVGKKVDGVDSNVELFEFEEDLLNRFFEILNDYDSDIVTGYNINNFDIPYIVDRVDILKKNKKNKKTIKSIVGRDGSNMQYRSIMNNKICSMPGRIVFDALPIIRKEFSLRQYTLQNVSKELLGKEKIDILPSEMEEHWKDTGEKIRKFIKYAKVDAELVLELVLKLQLMNKYIALSQVSGTILQEVLDSGQSSMVENLMLREFGKRDRIIPPKPDNITSNERKYHSDELKGGEVLEPEKGLLSNVLILDYKSLYPTIMMAHNLCYSTVIENSETSINAKDIIKSPTGGLFVSSKISKGIVPIILEDLLNKRVETKAKMRAAKTKEEQIMHNATQYALKLLLNSFYGYSGYIRARLYSLTLANSVTSFGRENIINTRLMVNDTIQKVSINDGVVSLLNETSFNSDNLVVSLSVVYGDTDSVFIQCKQDLEGEFLIENAECIGKKIAEVISKTLPDPMEIEFESFAKNALFIAKKRYALWIMSQEDGEWKDTIKIKGMETVRRDWCDLTSKTLKTVLEMVLKRGAIEDAIQHVRGVVDKIRNVDFTKDSDFMDELTLTKRFSKSKKSYKNKQPHLTVIRKIKERTGITPPIGERIPFVIVAGKDLIVERAEDPSFVREKNISIDVEYYVKKQILPPVERILGVFGVEMATLNYDSKQKGLFDFKDEMIVSASVPKKPQVKKDVPKQSSQKSLFEF